MDGSATRDFFISYNSRDEAWATWIAHELEAAGYSVAIQVWDFRPGMNFVVEMQEAASKAERTIAVVSPNFLASKFVGPEWAAAFAGDPMGTKAKLVPVKIAECDLDGLLRQIIHIDLVDLDEEDARRRLVAGVDPARAKPLAPPQFPGRTQRTGSGSSPLPSAATSTSGPLAWEPLPQGVAVDWRSTKDRTWSQESTTVEIHLVPVDSLRIEARRLRTLQDELIVIGRQAGLFAQTAPVASQCSEDLVVAQIESRSFRDPKAGLMVTRSGQRGAWLELPHDELGSVFDPKDLEPRLAAVIRVLASIDAARPSQFAPTASLRSTMMMSMSSVELVGRRSSASLGMRNEDIELAADGSIPADLVERFAEDVAAELVERLRIRVSNRHGS